MSDGMRDSRILGDLSIKLREASYQLRDAIRDADDGHRGTSIAIVPTVNEILAGTDYILMRKVQ